MHTIDLADGCYDLVVHSDTLEHLDDPVRALRECRRVLSRAGALCFTIPIVPGRFTRRRDGLPPSYHGTQSSPEFLVISEYGSDFWPQVLDAGFSQLRIEGAYWPTTVALIAER
jgi:SAM-dependent methyltransferase